MWSLLCATVGRLRGEMLSFDAVSSGLLLSPDLLCGSSAATVRVVWAAFVGLLLPAASCSHMMSVHVPGSGTVMVAGPFGGAGCGSVQGSGLLVGQIW